MCKLISSTLYWLQDICKVIFISQELVWTCDIFPSIFLFLRSIIGQHKWSSKLKLQFNLIILIYIFKGIPGVLDFTCSAQNCKVKWVKTLIQFDNFDLYIQKVYLVCWTLHALRKIADSLIAEINCNMKDQRS